MAVAARTLPSMVCPSVPDGTGSQFGTWGNVITITMGINCTVADEPSSWGSIKSLYR